MRARQDLHELNALTGSKFSLSHTHNAATDPHAITISDTNSICTQKHFKIQILGLQENGTCERKGGIIFLGMKLIAEILTGSMFYVEVGEDANVGDLKKEIGDQESLPTDRLILILDNTAKIPLLQDEVSLKDYGVQEGSHIYIFFKPLDHDPPTCTPPAPQDAVPNEPLTSMDVSKEPSDEIDDEPSTSVDSS